MPAFAKNPKVIAATAVVLWLAWVVYENFQLVPVQIHLFPWVVLQVRVSAVIIGSAISGAALALAVQFLWKRRSSKTGAVSSAAAP